VKSEVYDKVATYIKEATEHFLNTGVAYLKADWTDKSIPSLIQGPQMRSYLRMVAKEHKRPFVLARTSSWYAWEMLNGKYQRNHGKIAKRVELTVPKRTRFDVLVASLLLVAEKTELYGWDALQHMPLTMKENNTNWQFVFRGEGIAQFEHFLNKCHTNPVFKVALGTA
jgi:hypothetical protein